MNQEVSAPEAKTRVVHIIVNKKPVVMDDKSVTGLQIKEAALAQGVAIELDFQLARLVGGDQRKIIGDNDRVELHEGEKFAATAGDDNS